jgi:hypothetical protein
MEEAGGRSASESRLKAQGASAGAIEPVPIRVSFHVELPFDLGLPHDSTMTLFEGEGPIPGWEDVQVRPLPGLSPIQGLWAGTSLLFRRARVRSPEMLAATHKAFGEVIYANDGWLRRLRRRLPRRPSKKLQFLETRTVVQLTLIRPGPDAVDEEWLSDQFDAGLAKLNDYLVTVGAVTQDPAIGPISARDLPPAVICLVGEVTEEHPDPGFFLLHVGEQVEAEAVSFAQAEHMAHLVAKQHSDGHPFWLLGEALAETRRALDRGRPAHVVIEAGIAFEVLVSALVRELAALNGLPAEKVEGILDAGLKNVLIDHLPKLAGLCIDLNDPENIFGAWYVHAYDLRNRVVHGGYRPSLAEARQAANSVKAVVDHVGLELAAHERTREIGQMIAVPRPDYQPESHPSKS